MPTVRVAFAGKGGSGKSVIAGTAARLLARRGQPVLALDVDTLPGLSFSIGAGRGQDAGLPKDLAEKREGQGWVLREEVSAEELVDRHASDAPDGIRFLQLGKLPGWVSPGSVVAFRHVVRGFRRPGWSIVGDLAAGTRQAFSGWAAFATRIALVVEPTAASRLTATRLRAMSEAAPEATLGLVLNKVREAGSAEELAAGIDLPVWAQVPYDDRVARAEREGRALVDGSDEGPALTAIAGLVERLLRAEAQREADP